MTKENESAPGLPQQPATAPAVQTSAAFEPGDKVKHLNGHKYTVRYQNEEGVALEGVANLVAPSALRKI